MWVQSLGREDPLEKGMATHSGILVWRIPWTEEPGGVQRVTELDVTEVTQHTHTCNKLENNAKTQFKREKYTEDKIQVKISLFTK